MMRNLHAFVILGLLVGGPLFAGEISKVKGSNALVDLKGDSASPGDMFYTNADGKHKGIIQITKVKGDKAIAKIVKGKVDLGMTTEPRPASAGMAKRRRGGGGGGPASKDRSYLGVVLGFAMDKMSVQVNDFNTNANIGTANLSGNSFSAMGLFDYRMFTQIWFRGLAGVEGFAVSGTSICGTNNKEACNATIYYLAGDFLARYLFSEGSMRPWLGAGVELMFPASKTSTALNPASIGTTNALQVALGFDWFISRDSYIPFSVEYGLLPKSNEVEATWISVRAGMAFDF
jgi:hypothetical protein